MLRVRAAIAALPRLSPKHGFTAPSEDAFYLAAGRAHTLHGALADGVGSMRRHGLDPGAFPRALLRHSLAPLQRSAATLASSTPAAALAAGWAGVQQEGAQGACTACYFRLHLSRRSGGGGGGGGGAALEALNLGDCSLLVFRGGALLAAARQAHRGGAFDTPHQLGQLAGAASARHFEAPADAQPLACALQSGDTLLVCSDGLTDNLFPAEIAAHVAGGGGAAALALRLVADAHAKAQDGRRDGPFALAAKDADILWGAGGRLDDVTAMVLVLEASGDAPEAGGEAPLLDPREAQEVLSPCADAPRHLLPQNLALEPPGAGQAARRRKQAAPAAPQQQ